MDNWVLNDSDRCLVRHIDKKLGFRITAPSRQRLREMFPDAFDPDDQAIAALPPKRRIFCHHQWGVCHDLVDETSPEPHRCFHFTGHHGPHECGTCDALLELTPKEIANLDDPNE